MDLLNLFEGTAYHGSNHHFQEFSADHVGTGKGYQTFGWGIYLAAEKRIAQRYRKRGTGLVYVVDMPSEDELMIWEKPVPQQSSIVQQALHKLDYPALRQKAVDDELMTDYGTADTDTGEDVYGTLASVLMSPGPNPENYAEDRKRTSITLLKAGIAGIKYYDVESGRAKFDNYVIFDPRRITVKKTLKS
jgi:hypothetical protein